MSSSKKFFGKYRGVVVDNQDPLMICRIRAIVPEVFGDTLTSSWALPCLPYSAEGIGFFPIPAIGTNVWVEFERGDPAYPIWSGCFWSKNLSPEASGVTVEKRAREKHESSC
ncbi:MAG: phage baseplate assembly protein V [Candidatus Bathyarchaeia archaeon]